ncbi:MAG: hypothetical protein JJU20_12795 [Opitutales bacterium]|nr:hypothetical protein [Opitutales bacterium]
MRILRSLPLVSLVLLALGFGFREFNWRQNQLNWEAETAAQAARLAGKETALQENARALEAHDNELWELRGALNDQEALTAQREQQLRLWQGRCENLEADLAQRTAERNEFRETLRTERAERLQQERERRAQSNEELTALQKALTDAQEALAHCERSLRPPVAFAEVPLQAQSSGRSMIAVQRPADYPYERDATVLLRRPGQHWTAAQVRDATAEYLLVELFVPTEFGDTLVKAENLIMVWPTES